MKQVKQLNKGPSILELTALKQFKNMDQTKTFSTCCGESLPLPPFFGDVDLVRDYKPA